MAHIPVEPDPVAVAAIALACGAAGPRIAYSVDIVRHKIA